MSNKCYLVKGVNFMNRGYNRFQYPKRGDVEAPDWNDKEECYGGIFGIDSKSFKYDIRNDKYLIIEYNQDDGVVRLGKEKLKIKKGKVVYSSSKIDKIQKWLERRGHKYCGFGAKIKLKDTESIEVADTCIITAGKNCIIEAGMYCRIIAGDDCSVTSSNSGMITVGRNSRVSAGNWSEVSAGVGSVISWGRDMLDFYELEIAEDKDRKTYFGIVSDYKWVITEVTKEKRHE